MTDKVINKLKELKKNGDSSVQKYTQRGYIGFLKNKSWSKLEVSDKNIYEQFQKTVKFLADKENLSPLEYDYYLWNKKETPTAD